MTAVLIFCLSDAHPIPGFCDNFEGQVQKLQESLEKEINRIALECDKPNKPFLTHSTSGHSREEVLQCLFENVVCYQAFNPRSNAIENEMLSIFDNIGVSAVGKCTMSIPSQPYGKCTAEYDLYLKWEHDLRALHNLRDHHHLCY